MSDPNDRWKRFVEFGRVRVGAAPRGRPSDHDHESRSRLILEDEWQAQVKQIAVLCGWKFYHTHDSRGSDEGFPDVVALRVRDGKSRLVVAELKREDEDPTPVQQVWLELFAAVGAETFVWRPSNFEGMTRVLR